MNIDMKITIENYEAWLLDFIEGRLEEKQAEALKLFIYNHPFLGSWDELTGSMPAIVPEYQVFDGKESLKKPEIVAFGNINETNYEYYFISSIEGLLNKQEAKHLSIFLKANPDFVTVYRMYEHTRLTPDHTVYFPAKESLKVNTAEIVVNRQLVWSSVAAALVILFSVSWWFFGPSKVPQPKHQPPIVSGINPISDAKPAEIAETYAANSIETATTKAVQQNPAVEASEAVSDEEEVSFRHEVLPVMAAILSDAISLRTGGSPVYVRPLSASQMLKQNHGQLASSSQPERKPVLGRIVENAAEKLAANLLPSALVDRKPETVESQQGKSSLLWDLASAGVKTYNILTDKEVLFTKAHDSQGNVSAIKLQSDRINIARRIGSAGE